MHRLYTTRESVITAPGETVTSDKDQARLIRLGGLDSAWLVLPMSRTTRKEATHAARILRSSGVRRIGVAAGVA